MKLSIMVSIKIANSARYLVKKISLAQSPRWEMAQESETMAMSGVLVVYIDTGPNKRRHYMVIITVSIRLSPIVHCRHCTFRDAILVLSIPVGDGVPRCEQISFPFKQT